MKAWITMMTFALLSVGVASVAEAADCELSCNAECKQESAICAATASLDARMGRDQCNADAADAFAVCDSDAIDARSDCVGLCGPDLKGCATTAKASLKQCKESVKIDQAGCLNEVAGQLDADKQACSDDATDCAASCVQ